MSQSSQRPPADLLSGIRVLDLTNILSGPYATYQMALLGAEVIKVEKPKDGDLARKLGASPALNGQLMGTSFLAQNAGKLSVTVDLKHPEGKALFRDLVASADVLVENFRPGVMDRLGFGHEALRAANPGLIYCAISGFGQNGPLAGNPAYDQIVQGMSGVMSITGDADTAPLRVGYPLCDTLGGMAAGFAVVSALVKRGRTGEGAFIDLSMLDATLSAMGWAVSNYLIAGVEARPIGNQNMTAAPSGAFRCADGPINIAANKQEQFEKLCELVGRPELATDPRFAERETRKANRAAINAELEQALAAKTAQEWESLFNAHGIPAGRILTVPEILAHPQIAARDLVQDIAMPEADFGGVRVVRAGFDLADSQPAARCPPPWLGQHNARIYGELGRDQAALDHLRASGAI
ncbi:MULTISPECIES: CaiB/BaiF CoA transferase family protein [unclassified Novosphingobium]|uniref:CaiB/BaiF CoA transferase family protein n=1 Tax=unclassified Novosphingobium TaxID=2644732 RepID=UPI00086CA717|nr:MULTISPECIES: CoA transferase [unclassified Novosphingobium]MDR6707539.1 crotonobetainyl-CoA:carnitine CoA-transferase CaiB-like acyl-CoA transferase [Novosphingobium sp. 1748]ODU81067.1 MAG: CoA-transferase [Novosphingobium sp. SCN 63-17]OJX96281.1 MAG: CoA transferase [Novosphingobium sp. 63-713]